MDTTTPHPAPSPAIDPLETSPSRPAATTVEDTRPFGAHLRMSWWKPLVIIPVLLIAMFVLQFGATLVAILVETAAFGRDPLDMTLSPLMMVAVNLSLAVMGPLAVGFTALIARVPWRSLLASPRRMSMRRWGVFTGAFALLVLAMLGVSALLVPEMAGLKGFAITGTTIGLVLVALLTTPLQAAGEELMFRGALVPTVASWIRAAKPALIVGMTASSVVFGLVHMSLDPWLLSYYTAFGLCMAAMAVISRGLEAPIAFHVTNNVIMMVAGALFADGQGLVIDRSVGMGGPFMLLAIAVDLLAVGVVWMYERRQRS
ncbi:CPBP family intramembrane glutamic endopeptidase [Brachybacterium sp. UMB0905]|uniref:CPBP family intramembrane glutamic endopeptidase n=1 Tax=Brachybacterium sp. UMB0905 TaxID=2069310 RepID=UPI001E5E49A6|nr:type II CAAX endopeptidase family protein [Brachybacterium sp. UMB0905]